MDAKTSKLDLECAQRFDAGRAGQNSACVWLAQIPVPCGKMYRIIRREDGQSSPFVSLDGDLVSPSWAPGGPWERDPFASRLVPQY